ncbi:hypothetical protein NDU88_002579 [Pleurodeles waltl]|uniref:Uncharacterized protein n=1 Tax=Pleurodeles waltl TaxID=8319 RepID=A0AAV7P9S7_PLEWA|nr:hypothetical protein NDU88_002579 [Pleurodeles waltl]
MGPLGLWGIVRSALIIANPEQLGWACPAMYLQCWGLRVTALAGRLALVEVGPEAALKGPTQTPKPEPAGCGRCFKAPLKDDTHLPGTQALAEDVRKQRRHRCEKKKHLMKSFERDSFKERTVLLRQLRQQGSGSETQND